LFCAAVILFQGGILYWLFHAVLSLWRIPAAVPAAMASLCLLCQVFLAPSVITAFFAPPRGEEEPPPGPREEEVKSILGEEGAGNVRLLFRDDAIPFVLSFGSLWGKKIMAVSSGLVDALPGDSLRGILRREARLASRMDTGIFTAACFMPFVFHVISAWMLETGLQMKLRGGAGTAHLGGILAGWVRAFLGFPLLFISRARHRDADRHALAGGHSPQCLESGIEKIALLFLRPVQSGAPFRKRVYEGLRLFLPFCPGRWAHLAAWGMLAPGGLDGTILTPLGKMVEECNAFAGNEFFTSGHPPFNRRFVPGETAAPPGWLAGFCKTSCNDRRMAALPLFLPAVLAGVPFKAVLALPILGAAAGMAIRLAYFHLRKTGSPGDSLLCHSRVRLEGLVQGHGIQGEWDLPLFYLKGEKVSVPLILRQAVRSEDPFLPLLGRNVVVEGVMRAGVFPRLEVERIEPAGEGGSPAKSAWELFQAAAALALTALGVLLYLSAG
jgi:Zn-dependent protease with chaperone function